MTLLLVFYEDHFIWFPKLLQGDYGHIYTLYIYSYMYISCVSFTLVTVMEDSSTSEIDEEEEEQTTQNPDLTTGKCPPLHLEETLDILTS